MQRILPLVRFNLMETQFFRQDVFNLCHKGILTFGLRRVVRFNPLLGPEVEEEVVRLYYTRTPRLARSLPPSSYLLCLTPPDCRSPRSLLLAFGGWSRTGSGDTAVTGPSADILIFNPASRFNAEHQCHSYTGILIGHARLVLAGPGRGWSSACLSLWLTLLLQV